MIRAGSQAKTEPEGTQGQERDQQYAGLSQSGVPQGQSTNCQSTVLL